MPVSTVVKGVVAAVCSKCLWDFSPAMVIALFATVGGGITASILMTIRTLMKVYVRGVGPSTPKESDSYEGCVLAQYLPAIKGKICWKRLGNYPTPVHKLTLSKDGQPDVSIQVKREDLSNDIYGGNKVRSLEFLLPGPEQSRQPISTFGAPGSNQIVATAFHTPSEVTGIYMEREAGDRDNALNIMSFISHPEKNTILPLFASSLKPLSYYRIHQKVNTSPVLFPGGANPVGVLGNAGGFLEFVDQVRMGVADPVDVVILPLGSSCTTSGMILGLAIAEHLSIFPQLTDHLKVHGVIIHHALAFGQEKLGGVRWFIKQLVRDSAQILIDCGALPASVQQRAIEIAKDENKLKLTPYRGAKYGNPIYGKHSPHSLAAKEVLVRSSLSASDGSSVPPIWLCSTFTSKSAAVMLDELDVSPSTKYLFWQTKSAVQPVNKHVDVWSELEKQHPWVRKYVNRNITDKEEYVKVTSRL